MAELHLATPSEVRAAVDAVHEDIRIPHPSEKFPKGEIVVPWRTIATVDRLALLGGFRISEIVTKRNKNEGNTSDTLSLNYKKDDVVVHKVTGEEVLLIKVYALKKKSPVLREIGIPLDQRHEPWASMVRYQWRKAGGNPCNISRQTAWLANRVIFKGLGYKVKSWIKYKKDKNQKLIRDKNKKKIVEDIIPMHLHYGGNHFLRHIRATELRRMQLTREERTAFFSWSTINLGGAAVMDDYDQPEWFEYFPKLLKERKI